MSCNQLGFFLVLSFFLPDGCDLSLTSPCVVRVQVRHSSFPTFPTAARKLRSSTNVFTACVKKMNDGLKWAEVGRFWIAVDVWVQKRFAIKLRCGLESSGTLCCFLLFMCVFLTIITNVAVFMSFLFFSNPHYGKQEELKTQRNLNT